MKLVKLALGVFLLTAALSAQATVVTYVLGDHLDGALYDGFSTTGAFGPYGLRYDAIDPPNGDGPTFSVGDNLGGNGGLLLLSWDDANLAGGATISGSVYRNDTGETWSVTYSLTGLVSDGNGGWTATGGSGLLNSTIALTGMQNGAGFAFIFANDGHRLDGSTGWVGRGWFEGDGSNDFLVTGTLVPVPAAVWLFASALMGLGWLRRGL